MMDQLSSVNVEFIPGVLDTLFDSNVQFYKNPKQQASGNIFSSLLNLIKPKPKYWATEEIYKADAPVRPWALHKTQSAASAFYDLLGKSPRTPGLYKKVNPQTGLPTTTSLDYTNERIHSSVRVRLACHGLSVDDTEVWKCQPLVGLWRPRQVTAHYDDPIPKDANWGPSKPSSDVELAATAGERKTRWVWEYIGPQKSAPVFQTMVEDNLGPYEQYLLMISAGEDPHVFEYAEGKAEEFLRLTASK
jgi:hypothetical protein